VRFYGSETPIFHYTGREETETKGSHWGERTLDWTLNQTWLVRLVSSSRVQRAQAHRRVRSVTGPVHPVKPQRNCKEHEINRTQWHIRSRSTGHVRSRVVAYWNQLDAGTVASGQFERCIRLGLSACEPLATGR
jgi:hypothetical protein